MELDLRWRRGFRCAPNSPNTEPRVDALVRRPLGLYGEGPQDDEPGEGEGHA